MIVVKVGGSLFDHPLLVPALRTYLDSLAPADMLVVPGGGRVVDVVRKLDAIHSLGEESAHWLAIRGMDIAGELLRLALPCGSRLNVLDCLAFARDHDTLPHSWEVTSDSIAAHAAVVYGAERLVLLKSIDGDAGMSWEEVAACGWVDPHFPRIVAGATFPVEVVNFRRLMEASASV